MILSAGKMTQTDLLGSLLRDENVVINLRAASKSALLGELAKRAAAATVQSDAKLAAALAGREALGSTGFGAGIAVPHARIEGLRGMFVLFARLDRPVAFDAVDGKPVDLVMLLLSPASANSEHLATLAAISRRLRDPAVAAALRSAVSAEEARRILSGH